jgi:hypothetical protein
MNEDLQQACYSALAVPRHEARLRALDFSWGHAAQLFASYLVNTVQNGTQANPNGAKGSQGVRLPAATRGGNIS